MIFEAGGNWLPLVFRLLAVILIGLLLPQALGVLGYCWARRKGRVLKLATLMIPPAVFFGSANLFWGFSADAIRNSGNRVCGAFGAAAAFSTFLGTLLHLICGVILWLYVSFIWKRQSTAGAIDPAGNAVKVFYDSRKTQR